MPNIISVAFQFMNESALNSVVQKLERAVQLGTTVGSFGVGGNAGVGPNSLPQGATMNRKGDVYSSQGQYLGNMNQSHNRMRQAGQVVSGTAQAFGMLSAGAYIGASAYGTREAASQSADFERVNRIAQTTTTSLRDYRKALDDVGTSYGVSTQKIRDYYTALAQSGGYYRQQSALMKDISGIASMNISGVYSSQTAQNLAFTSRQLGGTISTQGQQAIALGAIQGGGMQGRGDELVNAINSLTQQMTLQAGGPALGPGSFNQMLPQIAAMLMYLGNTGLPGLKGQYGAQTYQAANQAVTGGAGIQNMLLAGYLGQTGQPISYFGLRKAQASGLTPDLAHYEAQRLLQMSGGNQDVLGTLALQAFPNLNPNQAVPFIGALSGMNPNVLKQLQGNTTNIANLTQDQLDAFQKAIQSGDIGQAQKILSGASGQGAQMDRGQQAMYNLQRVENDFVKAGDNLIGAMNAIANTLHGINRGIGGATSLPGVGDALSGLTYAGLGAFGLYKGFGLLNTVRGSIGTSGTIMSSGGSGGTLVPLGGTSLLGGIAATGPQIIPAGALGGSSALMLGGAGLAAGGALGGGWVGSKVGGIVANKTGASGGVRGAIEGGFTGGAAAGAGLGALAGLGVLDWATVPIGAVVGGIGGAGIGFLKNKLSGNSGGSTGAAGQETYGSNTLYVNQAAIKDLTLPADQLATALNQNPLKMVLDQGSSRQLSQDIAESFKRNGIGIGGGGGSSGSGGGGSSSSSGGRTSYTGGASPRLLPNARVGSVNLGVGRGNPAAGGPTWHNGTTTIPDFFQGFYGYNEPPVGPLNTNAMQLDPEQLRNVNEINTWSMNYGQSNGLSTTDSQSVNRVLDTVASYENNFHGGTNSIGAGGPFQLYGPGLVAAAGSGINSASVDLNALLQQNPNMINNVLDYLQKHPGDYAGAALWFESMIQNPGDYHNTNGNTTIYERGIPAWKGAVSVADTLTSGNSSQTNTGTTSTSKFSGFSTPPYVRDYSYIGKGPNPGTPEYLHNIKYINAFNQGIEGAPNAGIKSQYPASKYGLGSSGQFTSDKNAQYMAKSINVRVTGQVTINYPGGSQNVPLQQTGAVGYESAQTNPTAWSS